MQQKLCIYHGGCFDGFTAAWAVWRACGDEYEYVEGVYGREPPEVAGRHVLIVDFSYKRPVIDAMRRVAASIKILDHHKTAAEDLIGGWDEGEGLCPIEIVFDMNRSGAGIAWDVFHPGLERPALVDHVEDRDLWRFALPRTRHIHAGLSQYAFDFEAWNTASIDCVFGDLASQGEAIDRKHLRDINTLLPIVKRRMFIGGYKVWVANLPMTMTSDAGNIMSRGEPFAACYWDTPEGRVFSLRSSEGGVDVSEIAKRYGGGGHKNAAGFTLLHGEVP